MLSTSPLRHNERHPRILLNALRHPNVIENKLVTVVFALLNTDYDTLNEKSIKLVYKPSPQYLCFHVASLPTHWNFRLPQV